MLTNLDRMAGVAATAILLAGAAPLAAEVHETTDNGFVTRDTVEVAAPPLDTWLALIKPGGWWNDAHTWSGSAANLTLTPQAGGCFCEAIPGADSDQGFELAGSAQHAEVVQAVPLKVLRLRGGLGPLQSEPATGVLTITLEEIAGGTRIRWEYYVAGPMRYEIPTISQAVAGVMKQQIDGLRDHLGALGPADGESEGAQTDEPAPENGEE